MSHLHSTDRDTIQSLREATAALLRQGKVEDLIEVALDYIFSTLSQYSDRLINLEHSQQSLKVNMHSHIRSLNQQIRETASRFEPALSAKCQEIHALYENAAEERAAATSAASQQKTKAITKKQKARRARHSAAERHDVIISTEQGESDIDATSSDGMMSSLRSALRNGQLSTVRCLVTETGADVEFFNGHTPLIEAAQFGHLDILQHLLFEADADYEAISFLGNNALSVAAYNGHIEAVKLLWTATGTGLETPDVRGCTPLLVASGGGDVEVVKYLMGEARANAEATTNDGDGMLAVAAYSGHLEVVNFLVTEHGADTGRTNNAGMTPLLHASARGRLQIIEYLLGHRSASIDERCLDGGTCLHHASANGRLKVIKNLRRKTGANILDTDRRGLDSCRWAMVQLDKLIGESKSGGGGVSQAKIDRFRQTVEYLKTWRDEGTNTPTM